MRVLTNGPCDGGKEHGVGDGGGGICRGVLHDKGAMAEHVDHVTHMEGTHLTHLLALFIRGGRSGDSKRVDFCGGTI